MIKNKETVIFLFKLAVVISITSVWVSSNTIKYLIDNWLILFLVVTLILYIIFEYLNSLAYLIHISKLTRKKICFEKGNCEAKIYQSSVKFRLPMNSREALVDIPPKFVECHYTKTQDGLTLFCRRLSLHKLSYVYYNPVSVLFLKKNRDVKNFTHLSFKGNDLIILIKKKNTDMTKIEILDFKMKLHPKDIEFIDNMCNYSF